jgi:glutamate synthase domain-containing protein 3
MTVINAEGVHYKKLNEDIHQALAGGERQVALNNVRGQRYIGVGLDAGVEIDINGVPGNDLAAFMNGAVIKVNGNVQDGVGNTMNAGKIIVHGDAGDILCYAMRGGKVFIEGDVGYRSGIHMKAYQDNFPVLVIGGVAGDYLGEYMAGGVIVLLNLADRPQPAGYLVGTGMHGGAIFVRGQIDQSQVGAEVGFEPLSDQEWELLQGLLAEFFADLGLKPRALDREEFQKLYPKSRRPYGNLYSY